MYDFTNHTNEQLTARLEELRGIGENPGERTTEELETLAQERAAINAAQAAGGPGRRWRAHHRKHERPGPAERPG